MFCPRCGATNEANQRFCYNCGSRIEAASQGAAAPVAPPAQPETLPPPTYGSSLPLPPAPPAYGSPAPSYMPAVQNSGLAIASLVCGILGWVGLLPIVGAIAAIITGHMARAQINRSGGQISGRGLALAGLILGYAQMAFVLLAICAIIALAVSGADFS
jgi:hypothetical protein